MNRREWRESLKTVRFDEIDRFRICNWVLLRFPDGGCRWIWTGPTVPIEPTQEDYIAADLAFDAAREDRFFGR